MGLVRFSVGIAGVPYDRGTYLTSLTILVFLLAVIYGQRAKATGFGGYRHLIPVALLMSCAMYGFITLAILVEGLGGIHGYFHAPGAGFAPPHMSVSEHILGQLSVMGPMTAAILGTTFLGYLLSRHLAYLRNAFLVLAAMTVVRFAASQLGSLSSAVDLLTSLSLLAVGLAAYYGYRAFPQFGSYLDVLLMAFLIAFATFHLAVYGFAVSEGLGVSSYFNIASPKGTTVQRRIEEDLRSTPLLVAVLMAVASAGFALGRRPALRRSPPRDGETSP